MRKRAGKKRFRIRNLLSKEITLAIISIVAILALVFLFSSETFVGKAGEQSDCGNKIVEPGEECDEGFFDNGDEDSGCSSYCHIWDECVEMENGEVELSAKDANGKIIASGRFGAGMCFGPGSYLSYYSYKCLQDPVSYTREEVDCKNNEKCVDKEIPCKEGSTCFIKDGKKYSSMPECVLLNPNCGNRILDEDEDCDDPNEDSSGMFRQNCNGLGFPGGLIKCTDLCKYDVSACNPRQGEKCAEVSSGLVSWWPLEGNANDVVGKNNGLIQKIAGSDENDEIIYESTTGKFDLGKVNQAAVIEAVDIENPEEMIFVNVPNSPSLTPAQMSVSTWIKLDEDISFGDDEFWKYFSFILLIKGKPVGIKDGELSGDFSWYITTAKEGFIFIIKHQNGELSIVKAEAPLFKDIWNHLVATFDRNELKLYLNGNLISTEKAISNEPIAESEGGLSIPPLTFIPWFGSIDEVALWDRALSAEEVKAIYDAHNLGMCAYTPMPTSNAVDQGAAGAIGTTAAGNVAGTTYPGSAAVNSGAGTDSTAATVNKPVVGKKITVIDSVPANNIFSTRITATEDFTTEVTVYTILYGESNKVLSIKLEKIIGGLKTGTSYNAVVNYPQENIKKKTVIVYDVELKPSIYGSLTKAYISG